MCYHEIETVLRLHEFDIHCRLLKRQITKIAITRIQYTFNGISRVKLKLRWATHIPYINSCCDEIFGQPSVIKMQRFRCSSSYYKNFVCFCATLICILTILISSLCENSIRTSTHFSVSRHIDGVSRVFLKID